MCLNILRSTADGGTGGTPIHLLLRAVLEHASTVDDAIETLTSATVTASSAVTVATPGDTPPHVESSPAAAAASPSPATTRTLPAGTEIHAALDDSISSRRDSAGRTITAEVMQAVSDAGGEVVVPAGARVRLTVTQLAPAGDEARGRGQRAHADPPVRFHDFRAAGHESMPPHVLAGQRQRRR